MTLFHRQSGQLRTWARRTLWCIIVTGSLCAIVIPIFSIYRQEGNNTRSVVEVPPQDVSHTGDYIHVLGNVAGVDFENKNFRVHFEFTPHGTLAGDDGVLTVAISVSLFYTTLTFPDSQIMRSVDVTMPYTQGATIDYPFDAYKSYFEILANKDKEQLHKIPVSLTFLGKLQSIEFIPTVRLDTDDLYKIAIEIFTRRSPTTIGFSLFIVLIMWMLSIAIGIIAIQVIRKYRVSDEHVLTLGITTLFALPALRETQPGIPAIGCAADVLGFYWNMAIIAISSIMILMASALRWKEPCIKREIELAHKQHDFQSKLISEMAIPMPFPITGGPFSEYQIKKKRVPFMMSRRFWHRSGREHGRGGEDSKLRSGSGGSNTLTSSSSKGVGSSLGTPLYSEGGREYHRDPQMEGYFFTEDPDHPDNVLLRERQLQQQQYQQQEEEEYYWNELDGVLERDSPGQQGQAHGQRHGQQHNSRTSVCLSFTSSSTSSTSTSATATSSIPSPSASPPHRSKEYVTSNPRYVDRRHHFISTSTSTSTSSPHFQDAEQQLRALEIQRAALDQSDDSVISMPTHMPMPMPSSPGLWNSTNAITTPRWMYDYDVPAPPSYPLPPLPLSLSTVMETSTTTRGTRGVSSRHFGRQQQQQQQQQQHQNHHHYPESNSTATAMTSTTIHHTLLRR